MTFRKKQIAANCLMLLGSLIWGGAFVAQAIGAENLDAFTFGGIRFFLGAMIILPFMFILNKKKAGEPKTDAPFKDYLKGGILCGLSLFFGVTFQQLGLERTTAGKAGFITALYIILVPIFGFILYKRRLGVRVIAATLIALLGTFLLCFSGGGGVNLGDLYTLIGTLFWAAQILLIEKFGANLEGTKFAIIEFLTCAVMNFIVMALFEHPTLGAIEAAWIPIAYCSILSVGVGYTAQIICLKYTEPTVASLLMSSESVFSVIFGAIILHETLGGKQIVGCVLVFAAVLLAQINPKIIVRRTKTDEKSV